MRRILRSKSYLSVLLVAGCAAWASGAIYVWSGIDASDNWTAFCNWNGEEPCGTSYPDDSNDDALFPVVEGGTSNVWGDVNFDFTSPLTIDDMTVKDGVDFRGGGHNTRTLTVDTLVIDATNDAITVRFEHGIDYTAQ